MGQADLTRLLSALPRVTDPRALVGYESSDDAAVFRLGASDDPDAETILSTLDFFTPVVESPFDFGRIAAANALSDIWAMGGEPLFALNVVGFPTKKLPLEVLGEILKGGAAMAAEAGVPVLGGHSTDFDVPVYGMVVTGRAKASAIRRNVGARSGDALVLTKAIGTGIVTVALRAKALAAANGRPFDEESGPTEAEEAAAVASMARLNRDASRVAARIGVSAGTDVTGFGLLGHLGAMLRGSGVAAEISARSVPVLPGVRRLLSHGRVPGGTKRNLEAARGALDAAGIAEEDLLLLADAQTSGGLLLAVRPEEAGPLVAALRDSGDVAAARIGCILPSGTLPGGHVKVLP
ncbi:MAG: selenide, water dikinase SelD [Thermoanaerobaculia bacterium]